MPKSVENENPRMSEVGAGSSSWRRLVAPVLTLLVLVVIGRFGGHFWPGIEAQVTTMGAMGVALFWVVLVLLSVTCFPVSMLGFSAGTLFGWWLGLGLVYSGGLVSGLLMYWLGQGLFYAKVQEYIKTRPRLARLDRLARASSLRLNILTRLSPLNYGLASYVLAAGKPSLGHYCTGLLGTLPSAMAWVWLGTMTRSVAGAGESGSHAPWWLIGLGMALFAVLFWQVGRMAKEALASDDSARHGVGDSAADPGEGGFWQVPGSDGTVARKGKSSWEWDIAQGQMTVTEGFLVQLGYLHQGMHISAGWVETRIHPLDLPGVRESVRNFLRQNEPALVVEFRFRRADGVYIWLQVLALAVRKRKGKAQALLGTVLEITDRVVVAEERDRLFNLSPDLLASCDFRGNLQQVNPAWVRVLGWSRDDLMTRPLTEFVCSDHTTAVAEMLADLAAGRSVDGLETCWKTRSGGTCWLAWNCFPYEGDQRFFAVVRDISRRKDAEGKVQVYQDQLRKLSYQLSLVEDRQRRQLATALHDGLAQMLFAIRAQVTLLKYPEKISDPQAIIGQVMDLLDETMAETRSLSFQLFPPALTDVGLTAALHWLADQFDQRRGLVVTVTSAGEEPDLPQDVRSLLFQCTRELLNNVVKHARVDRAEIMVVFSPEKIDLTIADDGAGDAKLGQDPQYVGAKDEGGFGLFSIRERFLAVHGKVVIHSGPGQGTSVLLSLPLFCGTGEGLLDTPR